MSDAQETFAMLDATKIIDTVSEVEVYRQIAAICAKYNCEPKDGDLMPQAMRKILWCMQEMEAAIKGRQALDAQKANPAPAP